MKTIPFSLIALLLSIPAVFAANPYEDWPHTGSIYLLTTPEGANLPAKRNCPLR